MLHNVQIIPSCYMRSSEPHSRFRYTSPIVSLSVFIFSRFYNCASPHSLFGSSNLSLLPFNRCFIIIIIIIERRRRRRRRRKNPFPQPPHSASQHLVTNLVKNFLIPIRPHRHIAARPSSRTGQGQAKTSSTTATATATTFIQLYLSTHLRLVVRCK